MTQITATFDSGETKFFQTGTKALETLPNKGGLDQALVAVLIDNELKSLDTELESDCRISPVLSGSAIGATVYRRSLCFLLAIASRELFPERRLIAGMAIGTGFYHYYYDEIPLTEEQVEKLAGRIGDLVARDIPICLEKWSWEKACDYFVKSGQLDTLALLENLNEPQIPLNECAGFRDLQIAPLVSSTGILGTWELIPYHGGMLLRYPHKDKAGVIEPFEDVPLLYKISEEYKERGRVLGVGSVGVLNRLSASGRIGEYITVAEALQNRKIAALAEAVAAKADKVRVVLIAGPSSSGKTTTSKKLAIQLKVLGFEPIPIELDNFFIDRSRTPLDDEGKPDFECLEALDVTYLNELLLQLFSGDEVELPIYDFKAGTRRGTGQTLRLSGHEILILEGIHGLNDALTPKIPQENKFKIYVSALTQLNLDDHNRISTTDYRLLRRMVRDHNFRGHSARATLAMWPSVQRGERAHIFPFQNSADAALNSALDYELGVLKIFADPLLRTIKPSMPEYTEARRIQAFLDNFTPIPAQYVPKDSTLREFIGESAFHY
ncbi:MAG TPA: nucleoside kinase [Rectinemataceae bacterium]|nr:nucleoside kinase [Rectinemataceae bacterium]